MKSFAILALAATAALAQNAPSGCSPSTSGTFNIQTVNVTNSKTKRHLSARQLSGVLTLSLNNGILKDQAGRQGYIASNYQFQFDQPIQAGALQSNGFSLCGNNSLALSATGRSAPAIFYQCYSGGFYNLYSQSTGAQCIPIYISAVKTGGSSGGATQISDGQPQVTSPPKVSQISDGQPQAGTPRPSVVSQISDGQPQAGTPKPSPTPTPSRPLVSQISDGQPQAGTPKPSPAPTPSRPLVSQISDGQPQAGTPKPLPAPTPSRPLVSQISDGQPQAGTPKPLPAPTPSRPLVSQISDGQPQAGTPKPSPAPSPSRPLVSQISDGQPQVPTGNITLPSSPPQFTGAAAANHAAAGAFFAGLFGLAAML
ncbi:hypothetical protein ACEQ8H_007269 [Pleosporales sp. CAS-2024a]